MSASLVPVLLTGFVLMMSGCAFETDDCSCARDLWAPDVHGGDPGQGYDLPGRDTGIRPDGAVDVRPWHDLGPDGPGDTGPGPDAGDVPSDVPGDAPGELPDPGACAVPAPTTPFYLEVSGLPGGVEYYPEGIVSGDAVVVAVGEVQGLHIPARQVRLRMLADDSEVGIVWNLGPEIRVPVTLGQSVKVYASQRAPWWRDLVVVLWDADGIPVFFAHDGAYLEPWFDCDGRVPCPTFHVQEDTCPAVATTCGTAFRVPVFTWLGGGLLSSEAPMPLKQGQTAVNYNGTRYWVHKAYQQDQMECVDYPDRWFAGAAVLAHRSDAMGCGCRVSSDCARHEVCEPVLGRCVPDRCTPLALALAGTTCSADALCDPFTGQCNLDSSELEACRTALDCSDPGTSLCHQELRACDSPEVCDRPIGGVCVHDACQVVDCDARYCSSLLERCANCLADCDCAGEGPGMFCDVKDCRACQPDKIALTQENGGAWEFYELCANGDSASVVQASLRAIDATISCGVSGVFARCDKGQIACQGTGMDRVSERGMLDDASWGRLCALSLRDDVTRVVGGHYL